KTYQELHMLEEAEEHALEGLQYDEYNKELHYLLSLIAHELGNIERRNEHIQTAVELDHEYTDAVLFYLNLLDEEEDYEEIVHFTTLLEEQNIEEPLYTLERARAHKELEKYDLALEDYEHVYNYFKSDPPFLKEFSFYLLEEGKRKRALEMLEAYIKLEPLDEETINIIGQLNDNQTHE